MRSSKRSCSACPRAARVVARTDLSEAIDSITVERTKTVSTDFVLSSVNLLPKLDILMSTLFASGLRALVDTMAESISYRQYTGESDLPHIMALVQTELSEPYVIYTYRYFLHQWSVLLISLTHPLTPPRTGHSSHSSYVYRIQPCCFSLTRSTLQATAAGSSVPIGVIVCKQSMHKHVANRGYIAMLSVNKNWRKRGVGKPHPSPSSASSHAHSLLPTTPLT